MTTPNAELAYRVLDHIDADPSSWDQANWYHAKGCGTVACFAGWAVELDPRAEVLTNPLGFWMAVHVDGQRYDRFTPAALAVLGIEDDIVPGITESCECGSSNCERYDAELFAAHNTREDLGRYVEAIFGPRPGGAA